MAALGATVEGQIVVSTLSGELVVIDDFFTTQDVAEGMDDYSLPALHVGDLRKAVVFT